MVTAISRIKDMSTTDGLFTESLMAGMVQSGPEVAAGLAEFLRRKASDAAKRRDIVDTRPHPVMSHGVR
jgi:hypothetical protein